ncbi:MAG: 30S ribosomal protein S27ae [Thermoplasmatota archaeon]
MARYYEIVDNKVQRRNQWCPKCGPGVFLAAHRDRVSCGRCGYTEFKKEAAPQK